MLFLQKNGSKISYMYPKKIIKEKTILVLDQAMNNTGFSIWTLDFKLLHYGLFRLNDITSKNHENPVNEKIFNTNMFLLKALEFYNVEYVVLENIQKQANVKTFKHLSFLLGTLSNSLYAINKKHIIVPPTTWRKILGIKVKGREQQKKAAKDLVYKTYNIVASDDVAESICIGLAVSKKGFLYFSIIEQN